MKMTHGQARVRPGHRAEREKEPGRQEVHSRLFIHPRLFFPCLVLSLSLCFSYTARMGIAAACEWIHSQQLGAKPNSMLVIMSEGGTSMRRKQWRDIGRRAGGRRYDAFSLTRCMAQSPSLASFLPSSPLPCPVHSARFIQRVISERAAR